MIFPEKRLPKVGKPKTVQPQIASKTVWHQLASQFACARQQTLAEGVRRIRARRPGCRAARQPNDENENA